MPRRRPKRTPPHIPQCSDELTAEWFTDVLANGARVVDVRTEDIGTDVGFMGEVLRCHLTWAPDGADGSTKLPPSVVVKVPTHVPENFAVGDAVQSYEREIVVYQTLRSTLGIPMPEYLHGEMDRDPARWLDRPVLFLFDHLPIGGVNWVIDQFLKLAGKSRRRYVLVLEDIVDARAPSQWVGGSLEDAHAALEVLARFHASNWMRTDALDAYRRIWRVDRASRVFQASYVRNREAFVERFGTRVDERTLARLDEIQARVPQISSSLAAEPWTLLHGDYRLDNVLFRPGDELVVLDFQGLGAGRPAVDVAYFITTALTADHRDEEERLLRTYHEALVGAGVSNYSWDDLCHDCDLTKELLAHRLVGSGDVIDTTIGAKDRGEDTGDGGGEDESGGPRDGDVLLDLMQLRVLDWLS